jgi:hypothetical protein
MTGWAQINGLRGDTDLAERIKYDLWYLENWSLFLDFQIMFMTFFNLETEMERDEDGVVLGSTRLSGSQRLHRKGDATREAGCLWGQ